MISAGTLTERITLQKLVYKRNGSGEQVTDFEDYIFTRANVKYVKSLTTIVNGEMWDPTSIMITIRYDEKALKCRRVLWQGRAYLMSPPLGDKVNGSMTINATLYDEGAQRGEESET